MVVAEELYSARPEGLAENRHALEPWHLRKEESIEPTGCCSPSRRKRYGVKNSRLSLPEFYWPLPVFLRTQTVAK